MSTQKRESRKAPAALVSRTSLRQRRPHCSDRAGAIAPLARFVCATAGHVTAPLWSALLSIWVYHPSNENLLLGALVWVATKFLLADQLRGYSVRPLFVAGLSGSPRPPVRRRAAFGSPASPRSSLPPIPFLSGLARLHRILPQAPVALQHRAERYDGKRDLYFLHAA